MFRFLAPIFDRLRNRRSRQQIADQFLSQGFTPVACPVITELLPLRYPEIIRLNEVALFEKGDMQVLLVPAAFLPRTRIPHKPRTFALLLAPAAGLAGVSGALRDVREQFSIVDQLTWESYPSISPLPDFIIFAADEKSAKLMLDVIELRRGQPGSLVVHNGRLLIQMQL